MMDTVRGECALLPSLFFSHTSVSRTFLPHKTKDGRRNYCCAEKEVSLTFPMWVYVCVFVCLFDANNQMKPLVNKRDAPSRVLS